MNICLTLFLVINLLSKNSLISKFGDLDNKKLIIKNALISFFPINKRICKYELLQILEEVKKLCIKKGTYQYFEWT